MGRIIKLTESDLKKLIKNIIEEETNKKKVQPINEDEITYNYNMGIQCFLNKKGIKDNAGQPLKMDGSIGRLPNSKAAQAISKYQISIGVDGDGVWGPDTMGKMPPKDKQMFKACVAEHGDLFDKGLHFLGLDEQMVSAIGNAARSAAIKGGIAKQGNEIPQQLIDWLKKNNVKNGQWSQDPKNPQKIVVGYFPPSTLGYSRLATIVSIYRPSTISSGSKNGKWEFNGTTIIFK